MSCLVCALTYGYEGCEVFPARPNVDVSSACRYFEEASCERCRKFRRGACVLGENDPARCGEFSRG